MSKTHVQFGNPVEIDGGSGEWDDDLKKTMATIPQDFPSVSRSRVCEIHSRFILQFREPFSPIKSTRTLLRDLTWRLNPVVHSSFLGGFLENRMIHDNISPRATKEAKDKYMSMYERTIQDNL
jgi:hypothetical protein